MQVKVSHNQKMNADQSALVNQEIEIMLQEGVIQKMSHVSGKFLSKLFLIDKSNGEKRPVTNPFIPFQHFKMEDLHLSKDVLQKGDYICKIDLF